jgi:hypothetical protein
MTKLPAQESRVETGPMQFGDDWPGVFIRGDEALFMAQHIEQSLTLLPAEWFATKAMLEGLRDTLRSCSVGDTGWPP